MINTFYLQLAPSKVGPPLKHNFTGELLVDGQAVPLDGQDSFQSDWLEVKFLNPPKDGKITTIMICDCLDLDVAPDPKDYVHKKPRGQVAKFSDFNFKLAVIQELMFEQETLSPQFDIYSFVKVFEGREIDIEEEGYDVIPEVKAWFEALPISLSKLKKITKIRQDGGDDIFAQIYPFWDGECDTFDITSAEDIKLLPNLKEVTLIADESLRSAVEAQGVAFNTL